MTKWKPRKASGSMLGIRAQSKPLFGLKVPSMPWLDLVNDVLIGSVVGIGGFLAVNPNCLKLEGGHTPELGLAVALGATGLFWTLSGRNHFAIAGALSALGAYGICKYTEGRVPAVLG